MPLPGEEINDHPDKDLAKRSRVPLVFLIGGYGLGTSNCPPAKAESALRSRVVGERLLRLMGAKMDYLEWTDVRSELELMTTVRSFDERTALFGWVGESHLTICP